MKRRLTFKDTIIEYSVEYCDFGRLFSTDTLVEYYPEYGVVSVDERADEEYIFWAALHECICCGPNRELAPKVENPEELSGAVDMMLIKMMPRQYKNVYRKKRIEMYRTLVMNNLNPARNKCFRRAIELLES